MSNSAVSAEVKIVPKRNRRKKKKSIGNDQVPNGQQQQQQQTSSSHQKPFKVKDMVWRKVTSHIPGQSHLLGPYQVIEQKTTNIFLLKRLFDSLTCLTEKVKLVTATAEEIIPFTTTWYSKSFAHYSHSLKRKNSRQLSGKNQLKIRGQQETVERKAGKIANNVSSSSFGPTQGIFTLENSSSHHSSHRRHSFEKSHLITTTALEPQQDFPCVQAATTEEEVQTDLSQEEEGFHGQEPFDSKDNSENLSSALEAAEDIGVEPADSTEAIPQQVLLQETSPHQVEEQSRVLAEDNENLQQQLHGSSQLSCPLSLTNNNYLSDFTDTRGNCGLQSSAQNPNFLNFTRGPTKFPGDSVNIPPINKSVIQNNNGIRGSKLKAGSTLRVLKDAGQQFRKFFNRV